VKLDETDLAMKALSRRHGTAPNSGTRPYNTAQGPPIVSWLHGVGPPDEPQAVRAPGILPEIASSGAAGLWEWMAWPRLADVVVQTNVTRVRTKDGQWFEVAALATTNEDVVALIRQALADVGYLGDHHLGEYDVSVRRGRLWAVLDWGPSAVLVMRSHGGIEHDMDSIARSGLCSASLAAWLRRAFADCACNVLIAGAIGAGKTTLAGALARAIPIDQQVTTIEDVHELFLHEERPSCMAFLARRQNMEGTGERSMAQLLRGAKRSAADRVIVGEVRNGAEAAVMLEAMSAGHAGSLATTHAESAADALARLGDFALATRTGLTPDHAARQIARALHLVVFIEGAGASRHISEVYEVTGAEDGLVHGQHLWRAAPGSRVATRTPVAVSARLSTRIGHE
jgi:Flp pilus assembly CpaF family ATPase